MELGSPPVFRRSEADMPLRKAVIEQIRCFFEQRQSYLLLQKGFPDFVKRLELVLYKSASSKEEYCDPATLLDRLKTVAQQLQAQRGSCALTYNLDTILSREPQLAPQEDVSFAPNHGLSSRTAGKDIFHGVLDDAARKHQGHGMSCGPDARPQVLHQRPMVMGDKSAGWRTIVHTENQPLMSSDISEDGIVSAFETWSTSGTSSAPLLGIPDSSPWLGDTSNLYYSDDVVVGADHAMDIHSAASLEGQHKSQQQSLDAEGYGCAPSLGAGKLCSQVASLPRRRSCPPEYGMKMNNVNVPPGLEGSDFLNVSNSPQTWSMDASLVDATGQCHSPFVPQHDRQPQSFASCSQVYQPWLDVSIPGRGSEQGIDVETAPRFVTYGERLRSVSTQSVCGSVVHGVADGSRGVVHAHLPPGGVLADVGGSMESSCGSSLLAGRVTGVNDLTGVPQAPVMDAPDSTLGISAQGDQYLQSEGPMTSYCLGGGTDASVCETRKGTLLSDIPENAVAIGDLPLLGLGGPDSNSKGIQDSGLDALVSGKSLLGEDPQFSMAQGDCLSGWNCWTKVSGVAEDGKHACDVSRENRSQVGVKDELAHAYTCNNEQCSVICRQLKRVFGHARLCKIRRPACADCRWLGMLLGVHRTNCGKPDCPLPCCR